jgi:hypothetical protein
MAVPGTPGVVQGPVGVAKVGINWAVEGVKAGTSTKLVWNPETVWVRVCGTNALAANAAPMVIPTMAITVTMNHDLADFRVKNRCAFRMVLLEWSWNFPSI